MSLINEALKRARQFQSRHVTAPASDPALQPVTQPSTASEWWVRYVPIAAVVVLALGCGLLVLSWKTARASSNAAPVASASEAAALRSVTQAPDTSLIPKTPTAHQTVGASVSAVPSGPDETTNAAPSPALSVETDNPQTIVAEAGAAAEMPATTTNEVLSTDLPLDPSPPALKLQGIFYRAVNASALIDGETLFVGDEIGGAKVLAIERQLVRLVKDGKMIVLKIR